MIINTLKDKYSLLQLLKLLCISKSSYYYQKSVIKRPDKYQELRKKIVEIFKSNRNCYGIGAFTKN